MTSILEEHSVRIIIFIWLHLLLVINFFSMHWYPSLAGRVNAATMAGTWLLFVVLVRIPITRRSCLKDPRGLGILRLAFCVLWMIDPQNHDSDKKETWSGHSAKDLPRNIVMYYGVTLARVLGFIIMTSFWGNLKWNYSMFPMVRRLIFGGSKQTPHHLIPGENNVESSTHRRSLV